MKKYLCVAKLVASAWTLGVMAQAPALAQEANYPNRPIRLVVSQQAGGSSDTVARLWAEHAGKAHLTIGGAPAYDYPGGGINCIVDTAKVVNHAFTWVPTPATVAPVEYTMTKEDYAMIGGHMNCIKNVEDFPEYQKH